MTPSRARLLCSALAVWSQAAALELYKAAGNGDCMLIPSLIGQGVDVKWHNAEKVMRGSA